MHEVGIIIGIMKSVEKIAQENELTTIDTIVLQIGELSSIIPHYLEACYPAAVDGTFMENTKLELEVIPGNAMCDECNKVYRFLDNQESCPHCNSSKFKILSGREFNIKEIQGY